MLQGCNFSRLVGKEILIRNHHSKHYKKQYTSKIWINNIHREKPQHTQTKLKRLLKVWIWVLVIWIYEHLGICYIKSTNYQRFLYRNSIFKIINYSVKTTWVHFLLSILFALTLAFDRAVWYGNIAFSIARLSAQKWDCSFLKNVFVFQKFCSKFVAMKTFNDDSGISLSVFPSRTNLKLHNISATPKMIKKVITKLDSSKASGPDFIPVVVLKNGGSELSYILVELFNMCLKESRFPDCWKVSSVVPVFKDF